MDNGIRTLLAKLATKLIEEGISTSDLSNVEILNEIKSIIDVDDNLKTKLYILKNGISTPVELDTSSPYANTPIPVVITDITGTSTITIDAGDISVNIKHDGLDPSSVRIGNGISLVEVSSNNELLVREIKGNLGNTFKVSLETFTIGGAQNLIGISTPVKQVYISANETNLGWIRIAPTSNLIDTTGIVLYASEFISLDISDLINLYGCSEISGDFVTLTYII